MDPDPYSEYRSGSTKVLNTDPISIWVRIHNTSFRDLREIKDYLLRSTGETARASDLATVYIHRCLPLDLDQIVDGFVAADPRRMAL